MGTAVEAGGRASGRARRAPDADGPGRAGLLARHGDRYRPRRIIFLPVGRRNRPARSGVPQSAARRAWPVAGGGSHLRLERRRLATAAAGAMGDVRTACRHVHPRRHLRRHHSPPAGTARTGRHRAGAVAGRPVPRRPQLGLRRRLSLRRARLLRRGRGAEAAGGRLPSRRSGGDRGRGLQPPGSRG
jgi:hypothetical protein